MLWAGLAAVTLALAWFYGFVPRYNGISALAWWKSACNADLGYEHGPLVPVVAIGLCYSGALDSAERAVAPLLRSVPIQANLLEVQPYTKLQALLSSAIRN